ncbi:MAG: glucose-6-phosphate isomerase [Actinomycetota bacterium]|nr:glucose-6-phosphate isomerase [Actinomycetota bacterium]
MRNGARAAAAAEGLPAALVGKDAGLWGDAAREEASIRLGWLNLPESSADLLPRLDQMRDDALRDGLDHVVLCGMGGSSLAPEVIAATAGVGLTVLDSTDPDQISRTLGDRLDRTIVVVSSKSGGTIETETQSLAFLDAFRAAGLDDKAAAQRLVAVTDPGSPLEQRATDEGWREVVQADPNVGGRYSALSAFGLVPCALAGVDVGPLLEQARALLPALGSGTGNPGLDLGAALGAGWTVGRDKVVLADAGSGIVGFGDWAEQLIAESTGKEGRGLLPVVVEGVDAPGFATAGADAHLVVLGTPPDGFVGTAVTGPLGAQFLLWEYAVAVAGRILSINPFDQPNVQEAKDLTKRLLGSAQGGQLPEGEPAFVDGAVAVYAEPSVLGEARDVPAVLDLLCRAVPDRGYLAVLTYLDRLGDADAAWLRREVATRLGDRQVTFGWGPRYLHSTGQYHKGGPQHGVFLEITGEPRADLPIPGRPYTFRTLQLAQALGDLNALTSTGRPGVRLHLTDRQAGVRQLLDAARKGRE